MANGIKALFRMAPREDGQGGFTPSPVALKLATKSKTDYDHTYYPNAYRGGQKVLMVCTEERYMTMENGQKFSTGNHPVEMLVPLLHLEKAGFQIEVCTPTGAPVKIEMWAMPEKDDAVKGALQRYQPQFEKPRSLKDIVAAGLENNADYIAVFIPGGHGAMLGLPDNDDLQTLIRWVNATDRYMLTICHGPAALLAENRGGDPKDFAYRGYKMAVFPDSLDKLTPKFGYLPGPMPWYFGDRLREQGVEIINKKANGTCCTDRKLITGDSPDAANEFGKLAARALLAEVNGAG
ncbi:MAG: protein deglycase HchA [Thiohalomonadales bacterium]|nr:protein deglycase HchA [Thiohalomonadales bacterium]